MPVSDTWKKIRTTTAYKGFVMINRQTYEEPSGAVTDWASLPAVTLQRPSHSHLQQVTSSFSNSSALDPRRHCPNSPGDTSTATSNPRLQLFENYEKKPATTQNQPSTPAQSGGLRTHRDVSTSSSRPTLQRHMRRRGMSLNRATCAFFPFQNSWIFWSAENSPTLDLPAAVWQPSRAAIRIAKFSPISVTASANF